MQSRRNFIKNSCSVCVGLIGMQWLLESCHTAQPVFLATMQQNQLAVPLSAFADKNALLVRHANLSYDILLVKEQDVYRAFEMKCTHNDVALHFTGQKLVCQSHGSEFDLQGNVIKDPAPRPLKKYHTKIQDQQIIIF